MTDHNSLSTAQFADLLSRKLRGYQPVHGKLSSRMFYFDGQDAFAFAEPASAIAALHHDLLPDAKARLEAALLDVLGSRGEPLSDLALEQLVMAVGELRRRALLAPMVGRVCARARYGGAPRALFVTAIMVLKGFGAQSTAFEATRALCTAAGFPPDLLPDAFEILLADESNPWADCFIDVRDRLEVDHARDPGRVRERIGYTAAMLMQLPRASVNAGLQRLMDTDRDLLAGRPLHRRGDVTALLVSALVAAGATVPHVEIAPSVSDTDDLMAFLEAAA